MADDLKIDNEPAPLEIKQVLRIGITEDKVVIDGQLANKALCLQCLAEAIKLVVAYDPPRIHRPGIMNRLTKGAFGDNGGRRKR